MIGMNESIDPSMMQSSINSPRLAGSSNASMLDDRSSMEAINHSHPSNPHHHLYTPSSISSTLSIPINDPSSGHYHNNPLLYATPAIIHTPATPVSSAMTAAAAPFTPLMIPPMSSELPANYPPPLFPSRMYSLHSQAQLSSSQGADNSNAEIRSSLSIPSSINPLSVFSARTIQLYREKESGKLIKKQHSELNILLSEEGKEFISELCRLYSAMVDIPYRNARILYDQQQKQIAIDSSNPHLHHPTMNAPMDTSFIENYRQCVHRLCLFTQFTQTAVEQALEKVIESVPHQHFLIIFNLAKKFGVKSMHEQKWYYDAEDKNKGSNRRMTMLRSRLRSTIASNLPNNPHAVHQFFTEIDQMMKAIILIENSVSSIQQQQQSIPAILPPSSSATSNNQQIHQTKAAGSLSSSSAASSSDDSSPNGGSMKRAKTSEEDRATPTTREEKESSELSHKSPHRESGQTQG